jgi:hypothetical protein
MMEWDDTPHFEDAMRYFAAYRYNRPTQQKEKPMATNKLYQINVPEEAIKYGHKLTTIKYGHKLAVDSTGKWVMEIKGTGEVQSYDKSLIEDVMPYTVAVQFDSNKQVYQYLANKDQVELNAFYIFDSAMGREIVQVTKLDTKSSSATVEFKPLAKLTTVLV